MTRQRILDELLIMAAWNLVFGSGDMRALERRCAQLIAEGANFRLPAERPV